MTLIAGINAYNHNASLSLVLNGKLLFAAEEERFNRIKHSDALPVLALQAGLRTIGASLSDIDKVTYCWDWRTGVSARLPYLLKHFMDPTAMYYLSGLNRATRLRKIRAMPRDVNRMIGRRVPFVPVSHHLAHAASAFLTSNADRAAILSVDGVGEWDPVWMGTGEGSSISAIKTIPFPNSIGFAYDAVCQLLGFRKREDVGKVMGLAAYGDAARHRNFFREWIRLENDGGFSINPDFITWHRYFGFGPEPMYSSKLTERLGPPRRREDPLEPRQHDIAAAMQERFEEVMLHFARHLKKTTGLPDLCMAGGCALNCLANRRILEESGFDRVSVFPAASDAGAGAGAALYASSLMGHPRTELTRLDLGIETSETDITEAFNATALRVEHPSDLAERVAALLAAGNVVGWVQGRMEFGPRALGFRSLLADPRSPAMKDIMNAKVKHRESFRPFAPVCTEEDAPRWFNGPIPSPWMMFAVPVKPEARGKLGAVTHIDNTARLQTVSDAQNPRLHDLLKSFEIITGVPVLLNTSFNLAGQPVVATAYDAVTCFLATGIDALVMGNRLVVKR